MKYFSFLLGFFILLSACSPTDKYHISHYYNDEVRDTILTNIIVNIYKVPRGVSKADKHKPEFRKLYISQVGNFEFLRYFIDSDGVHYFYLMRPARSAGDLRRGVAGKYRMDEQYNLLEFEEIYNTPMLEADLVKSRGEELWADLMYFKNVDRYLRNEEYIEFPNSRVKYDKVLKEWVY